jgi:predicted ATPase/transcriptional regulator with XRE-family HTH domain
MATAQPLSFAAALKRSRRAAGLTQEELAERAGYSVSYISMLERGGRGAVPATVELLADALRLAGNDRAAFEAAARRGVVRAPQAVLVPLTTLEARPHNLPVQPTPLLGREREVEAVTALFRRDDVRLVTLTGPGGIGKTRLAQQIAAEVLDAFADGVWFVRLSRLTDPALVVPTIARTLGLQEAGSQSIEETLLGHLRRKRVLLLLDNFEQLLAAAPRVAALLEACPPLTVLVTSRERLHLSGEHEYPIPPLSVPAPHELPLPERLSQYAAVALFIQRAEAVQPDFALTPATAPAVGDIVVRLDGLPLAIELAAARVKVLPPPALLKRLDRRLAVLTGGPRDVPEHQQTMQGTIAWSYDLLTPAEQRLFRRLSVFVGGGTLEAAEAVCTRAGNIEELGLDVLAGLESLVDKSLVQQREEGGEPRFGMLQIIREFGVAELEARGEVETLRWAHFDHYLALAEQGELELYRSEQLAWRARLDREHDNLRAALGWARDHGEAELGLRLAGALFLYWAIVATFSEMGRWSEELLALAARPGGRGAAVSPVTRAKALWGAGGAAVMQGDTERGVPLLEQSVALARELPGYVAGLALTVLGIAAEHQGDLERAMAYFEDSLAQLRLLGEPGLIAVPIINLGEAAYRRGDLARATDYLEETLVFARRSGDRRITAYALFTLAGVARRQGALARAAALAHEALTLMREIGGPYYLAYCLETLAEIAGATGQGVRAARLLGAAATLREHSGAPSATIEREETEAAVAAARAALGEKAWAAAFAAGRTLSLEAAIAEALGDGAAAAPAGHG